MEQYANLVGIGAGICTAISMVPQLFKIMREKRAQNISYVMLGILLTGLAGWVWYGILQEDYPVIITNAFSFLVNACVLVFATRYKQ